MIESLSLFSCYSNILYETEDGWGGGMGQIDDGQTESGGSGGDPRFCSGEEVAIESHNAPQP
jgi:hypothetical protein